MLATVLLDVYLKTFKNIQMIEHRLASLPQGSLYPAKKGTRTYYYHQFYAEGVRHQKYVRSKSEAIIANLLAQNQYFL